MAGIFNLFGAIPETDNGQVMKSLARSKTSLGIVGTPAKAIAQQKPKGLSIRPNSDLNIPVTFRIGNSKQVSSNIKQPKFLKPKLTQLDNSGRPVSPTKELIVKKSNAQTVKGKGTSPGKDVCRKKAMKIWEPPPENVFKKPLPPKEISRKPVLPEPEELAPYYDPKLELDDTYAAILRNDFKELFKMKKVDIKPYEDEGFESDSDQISVEIPKLCESPLSVDKEWKEDWTPELPDISDDSDF